MFISGPVLQKFKEKYNYTDSSLKAVDNDMKRLYKLAFPGLNYFYPTNLKDYDKVIEAIESPKITPVAAFPKSAWSRVLLYVIRFYKDSLRPKKDIVDKYEKKYKEAIDLGMQQNTLKPAKTEAIQMTTDKLSDELDRWQKLAIEKPSPSVLQKYLLVAFYYYLPALRGQDLYNTQWLDREPDSKNYIDLANKKLVIKDYKTAKSHNTRTLDLPNDLVKILQVVHDTMDSPYVLPNLSDYTKPRTSSAHTKFMNSIFGGNISTDALRHSYVSELYDLGATPEEKKQAAKDMGHTVSTQAMTYTSMADTVHKGQNVKSIYEENKQLKQKIETLVEGMQKLIESLKQ